MRNGGFGPHFFVCLSKAYQVRRVLSCTAGTTGDSQMFTIPTPELVGKWTTEQRVDALHWVEGRSKHGARSKIHVGDMPDTGVTLRTSEPMPKPLYCSATKKGAYDKSLFASHNRETKVASRWNRKEQIKLNKSLPADEHQAQRAWRKTVNVIKLTDAKDELRKIEQTVVQPSMLTLKRRDMLDQAEFVARLNARCIIRK